MKHQIFTLILILILFISCHSQEETTNTQIDQNIADNSISNNIGNIIYSEDPSAEDLVDESLTLNICDLSSADVDTIALVKVKNIGRLYSIDNCIENNINYHRPYLEVTLDILAIGAGENLPNEINVRNVGLSSGAIDVGDMLLGYFRTSEGILYLQGYFFAFHEEDSDRRNKDITIDVPKDFDEFSRLLQLTYTQNNPDCPADTRLTDDEFKEYLTYDEGCEPPILDEESN
jgi:hypothetical protein